MADARAITEYYAFDSFKWHFKYFKLLGVTTEVYPKRYQRNLYRIQTALMCLAVHLYFPLHIFYGLFQLTNPREILENFEMWLVFVICSMKVFILRGKLSVLHEIEEISKEFEKKAKQNREEYAFILEFKSKSRTIMKVYYVTFTALVIFGTMNVFAYDSRRLVYTGYFPYDFKDNVFVYVLTVFYQMVTWIIDVYANAHYDTYPGLLMFLLSQHIKILNLRISRVGYDSKICDDDHHQLLKQAVEDHKRILQFHKLVNNVISKQCLALFLSSSLNIVCSVILFMFFAENAYQKLYYLQIGICFALETSLSCYYGSEFEENMSKITESLYSCNWYEQPKAFKTILSIFLECSLRKYEFSAGGIIPVNKATFLKIIRRASSLYAVLNSMRKNF